MPEWVQAAIQGVTALPKRRQLASKWAKTIVLLSDRRVAGHIPESRLYTTQNLLVMLNKYGSVVMKPIVGAGGHGVIKVNRGANGYNLYHYSRVHAGLSYKGLTRLIGKIRKRRRYMIQRTIHMATISGRPIDYRVKVQKIGHNWHFRALVGRLAKPGLFVTNLCRGGTQLTAAQGIARSLSPKLVRHKKNEMKELTRSCSKILESKFPGISLLGYDYGIDRSGHIWIFEVNTRPQ
ncbi:YheC/YheD family protein [Paenibacillus gansuensis]|uniref:YheC/YheD family protein n=1 Tax=Paenibacillus gansuensis TaxID=306542 RepID=A0ABW5PEV5_9BACL